MTIFLNLIGILGGLLILALAAFAIIGLVAMAWDHAGRRLDSDAQRAERQIVELGRQAQQAILGEALRRVYQQGGRQEPADPRPPSSRAE